MIGVLPLALHWLNIVAAFIAVIFGAFINGLNSNVPQWLNDLSYAKWATESLLIAEFQTGKIDLQIQDDPHYSVSIVAGVFGKLGFCKTVVSKTASIYDLLLTLLGGTSNPWKNCKTHLWILFLIGTIGRCVAAVLLLCIENSEHIKLWLSSIHWHIKKYIYKNKVPPKRRRSSVEANALWMSTYHIGVPHAPPHPQR